ncbi:MAG: hypothetical protein WA414_01075 [Acidobacteriaceae bacterium]
MKASRQQRSTKPESLKDEVYRQVLRLEAGYPGADVHLAAALLRSWMIIAEHPTQSQFRRWVSTISPICLRLIEFPTRIDVRSPSSSLHSTRARKQTA